jgi:DNA-binding SARP family transcriptional activator
MLALYRAGRQADALAAYREARRMLVEELGVEPSQELRRLEQAILAQDPGLEAPAPTAGRRSNLPLQAEPLLGRKRELADLRRMLGRGAGGS